jgi:hypothetical protein
VDLVRESVRIVMQELIEAEATEAIRHSLTSGSLTKLPSRVVQPCPRPSRSTRSQGVAAVSQRHRRTRDRLATSRKTASDLHKHW